MKKYKTVEVKTQKGTFRLQFKPGERFYNKQDSGEVSICDIDCPYCKICGILPDPEYMDKPEMRFCDFCTRIGDHVETQEEKEIRFYHPVEGTIENELGEFFPEILEIVVEKNPLFRLDTIIDRVCPGMCSEYNPQHSNCGKRNALCILTDLFTGPIPKESYDNPVNMYDTDREEDNPFESLES